MNKKTKGLIAGVVGAGLLLGAGGTFALWFDTAALGSDGDTVNTGRLAVGDDVDGHWQWVKQSDGLTNLVHTNANGATLVPGDTVEYVWDRDQIELILTGDTIIANLYLDGVGYVNPTDIAPLTLTISTDGWTSGPVTSVGGYGAAGGFILLGGLRANTVPEYFELPSIVLNFPQDGTQVGTPTTRPFGYGHQPSAALGGYGRYRTDVLAGVFTPGALQIRLQQLPTPTSVDAGTVSGPQDAEGNPIPAPAVLNSLPVAARVALYEYVVNGVPFESGFAAPSVVALLNGWLAEASDADVAAWLAGN